MGNEENSKSLISRRTVAKGMAWTVPVVAATVATPFRAASGETPPEVDFKGDDGGFCKHPGNPKWYHGILVIDNTANAVAVTISVTNMTVNGVEKPAHFSKSGVFAQSYTIPAGTKLSLWVDAGTFGDSANSTAVLPYSYDFDNGGSGTGSATATANDLPPCGTGSDPNGNPGGNPPHSTDGPN